MIIIKKEAKAKILDSVCRFHGSRLYLRQMHTRLHPFSQLWVARAQQGTPINFHVWKLSSASPVTGGSAPLKILWPCPLHKCLWQLMWHMPSSPAAGEAERQRCLYRLQRAEFTGPSPAAIYKTVICYLWSWLLPKKNDIADLCQHRRKMCSVMPNKCVSLVVMSCAGKVSDLTKYL